MADNSLSATVTHEQAREAYKKLHDHVYCGGRIPTLSVPPQPTDVDIVLCNYIEQQAALSVESGEGTPQLGTLCKHVFSKQSGCCLRCGVPEGRELSPTPWDFSTWGFYCDYCRKFFDLLKEGRVDVDDNHNSTVWHRACETSARYVGYERINWPTSGELASEDGYVAYCRFTERGRIITCDSDAPKAFKVYRHPVAALSVGEPATINTPEMDDRPLGPLNVCAVCGTEWDAGDSCPTCPEQCCCLEFWTSHHPDCPAKLAGAPRKDTAATGWINVEDRLPEMDGKPYLVVRNNIADDQWDKDWFGGGRDLTCAQGQAAWYNFVKFGKGITHWRELPALPELAGAPAEKTE